MVSCFVRHVSVTLSVRWTLLIKFQFSTLYFFNSFKFYLVVNDITIKNKLFVNVEWVTSTGVEIGGL